MSKADWTSCQNCGAPLDPGEDRWMWCPACNRAWLALALEVGLVAPEMNGQRKCEMCNDWFPFVDASRWCVRCTDTYSDAELLRGFNDGRV